MKTQNPYGANDTVKETPAIIGADRSKNGGKATARYPSKPLGNVPGGSADTKGSFKRAYTPGTSPAGS